MLRGKCCSNARVGICTASSSFADGFTLLDGFTLSSGFTLSDEMAKGIMVTTGGQYVGLYPDQHITHHVGVFFLLGVKRFSREKTGVLSHDEDLQVMGGIVSGDYCMHAG